MDINCCIAMTAGEFSAAKTLPRRVGWMACHFSQRDSGLSNLPSTLPESSVLIMDDSRPPAGHDPRLIAEQLTEAVQKLGVETVLLDLQDPGNPETAAIAEHLAAALPCSVCVAAPYAEGLSCPVLVPMPPPHIHLERCLAPWKGRQIWLEATLEAEQITVTEQGSSVISLPFTDLTGDCFTEDALRCRYQIREHEKQVAFTLVRDRDMLRKLLGDAVKQGVYHFIGLYQQLGSGEILL